MRTIRLNGQLGKKYGRVHKLDVKTPAEAVRALCANYPDFQSDLAASTDKGIAYKCVVDKEDIDEEGLAFPISKSFSITPVVMGAGKIGKIILGVALIAVAVFAPQLIPTLAINGTTIFSAATVFWMGVAITLGGVAQLLAAVPKNDPEGKTDNNVFDGPVNVTAQGAPVPIGYGRMITGSAVISAGITIESQPPMTPGTTDYWMSNFAGGWRL